MSTSPPWRTDEWDLRLDLKKIDQQWGSVRRVLDDAGLFTRTEPDVSSWGCGQHAGHVILVAASIAEQIEGNLAEPDRNRGETTQEPALRLLTTGGFTRGVATAPPETRPEGRTRDEFLELLPPTVAAWERIRIRADEIPECAARYRHFALGYLTSAEWVRMCAVHTAHHLKVVRDIAGEESLDPHVARSTR